MAYYCWWFRNPKANHLGCITPVVNHGKPTSTCEGRISEPSRVLLKQQPIPGSKRLKKRKPNLIPKLGVGFKHFLSSPLFGENSDFMNPLLARVVSFWVFNHRWFNGFLDVSSLLRPRWNYMADSGEVPLMETTEYLWNYMHSIRMCHFTCLNILMYCIMCVYCLIYILERTCDITVIYSHTWSPQHTFNLLFGLEKNYLWTSSLQ